jgi:hypothetical protein
MTEKDVVVWRMYIVTMVMHWNVTRSGIQLLDQVVKIFEHFVEKRVRRG